MSCTIRIIPLLLSSGKMVLNNITHAVVDVPQGACFMKGPWIKDAKAGPLLCAWQKLGAWAGASPRERACSPPPVPPRGVCVALKTARAASCCERTLASWPSPPDGHGVSCRFFLEDWAQGAAGGSRTEPPKKDGAVLRRSQHRAHGVVTRGQTCLGSQRGRMGLNPA